MKSLTLFICCSFAFNVTAQYLQQPLPVHQADYSVCIEMASKRNKKYIRHFNSEKKTIKPVWNPLPEEVNPSKGLYMIKLSADAGIDYQQISIRKAHIDENNSTEVRSILPANYYRIERPDQKTIELYFSKGANTFFAENPGFVIISGMKKANNCAMPDLVLGSQSYEKLTSNRHKNTPQHLTASR